MPDEVRIWKVGESQSLAEITRSRLDFEDRLEKWLVDDISVLSPTLLIIGQQVETDFGKIIDLLCITSNGDLVIVELKRDKTPREVTAQVLDYASWVKGLSHERILALAEIYFAKQSTNFDTVFQDKFDIEIPDVLNDSHAMLIVASEIDESTERIIKYLSDSYGVNINVAQFQYYKDVKGEEFVSRIFLIEQEEVQQKAISKGGSKRAPYPSVRELEELAVNNGVGDSIRKLLSGLERRFSISTGRTMIRFKGVLDGNSRAIFNLVPEKSDSTQGVYFQIYLQRFASYVGIDLDTATKLLPKNRNNWKYYENADDDYSGYDGYFSSEDEIEIFLIGVQNTRRH